jgi:hypothetical protein
VVFAPGVCPDPGPGGTVGGTTSGGPGVGLTITICPAPGPGGTSPGARVGGPTIGLVGGTITAIGMVFCFLKNIFIASTSKNSTAKI